ERPQPSHSGAAPQTCVKGAVLPRRKLRQSRPSVPRQKCRVASAVRSLGQPTRPHDDRTVPSRRPCSRTFPARIAASPTQLSRAATSLRKRDHALPNDAALSQGRGKSVQLSCSELHIDLATDLLKTKDLAPKFSIISHATAPHQ